MGNKMVQDSLFEINLTDPFIFSNTKVTLIDHVQHKVLETGGSDFCGILWMIYKLHKQEKSLSTG